MSRDLETIRRSFDVYNRHGIRAVARDYWHPDIEWEVGPWSVLVGGHSLVRGPAAVIALFDDIEALGGRFTTEVVEAAEGGEGIFLEVRLRGEGAASGAVVDQRLWYAVQLEAGRARRVRILGSRADALEAVGLAE